MNAKFKSWADNRISPWVKIIGLLVTGMALTKACGFAGPCIPPNWAFQTTATAQETQRSNEKVHGKHEKSIAKVEGKVDAVQATSNAILKALPKHWKNRKGKNK